MRIVRALIRRLTGADVRALRREVAQVQVTLDALARVIMDLNHDVRSGSEEALPLFQGYLERLRLDADSAIAATAVIDRQLAEMRDLSQRLTR